MYIIIHLNNPIVEWSVPCGQASQHSPTHTWEHPATSTLAPTGSGRLHGEAFHWVAYTIVVSCPEVVNRKTVNANCYVVANFL